VSGALRVLSGGLQVGCRVHLECSVEACRLSQVEGLRTMYDLIVLAWVLCPDGGSRPTPASALPVWLHT
jgi:hypothetical protein